MMPHSRRDFLRRTGALASGTMAAGAVGSAFPGVAAGAEDPWRRAGRIVDRVRPPRFPRRAFPITRYGAVGDGVTDCTAAIAAAVRDCHRSGGGHVVVPAGTFLTGAVTLLSGVDLHLEGGSRLLFSQDPAAYPTVYTRWQGIEMYGRSAFVYAYGQRDIAVTGSGVLDGQADNGHWWPWSGSAAYGWQPGMPDQNDDWNALQALADQGAPVPRRQFGQGHYLRPNFVQPYRCRNVLIEGVTILRSPMWELNPVLCRNVTVRGVTVDSHGPNNDGCDPECCRDVVIEGCSFSTGDDCVALKSGRNADGRRVGVPCENVVIRDCDFADGHGGVTIGSEMSGGVREVFAENLRLSSPNLGYGLRLKTNSARGGYIHDVYLRDTTIGQVANQAVLIDFFYGEGPGHGFDPAVGGIHVDRLTVRDAGQPWYLVGYPEDHITGVTLTRCDFQHADQEPVSQYVDGLILRDITVNGAPITG